jgi:hypothetical protein
MSLKTTLRQSSWVSGKNHFIFNMKASELTNQFHYRLGLAYQAAIITSSAFQSNVYRNRFDITAPLYNTLTANLETSDKYINDLSKKLTKYELN